MSVEVEQDFSKLKWTDNPSQILLDRIGRELREVFANEASNLTFQVIEAGDVQGLLQAASKFLGSFRQLQGLENLSTAQQLLQIPYTEADAAAYKEIFKKNMNLYLRQPDLVKEALEFQIQLNAFLDRSIYLTVVDKTGRVWFYSEVGEYELLSKKKSRKMDVSQDSPDNRLKKITGTSKKLTTATKGAAIMAVPNMDYKAMSKKQQKTYSNLNAYTSKNYDNLVKTYQMVIRRYDKKTKIKGKQVSTIYYHHNSPARTNYLPLPTLGIAGEAYVAALFQTSEKDSNFANDFHYNEPGIAYFYSRYCMGTDSRAGVVLGDIASSPLDKVQLAVKATGEASSASFLPLADTASKILELGQSGVSRDKIKKYWLEQEKDSGESMYTNAVQITREKLEKDVLEDLKQIVSEAFKSK